MDLATSLNGDRAVVLFETVRQVTDGLQASDYIAISSALIALITFGATIWQAHIAHHHNRLSVMPRLVTTCGLRHGGSACLTVKNSGLGPALLMSCTITLLDKEYSLSGRSLLNALRPYCEPVCLQPHLTMLGPDVVIPAGAEIALLRFENSATNPKQEEIACWLLDRMFIDLVYKSMYGDVRSVGKRRVHPPSILSEQ
ncbi:MAG: hypothetical protein JWL63_3214 [Rhodocyclales bacterium]|nr:hypothetical protein [Rhodocyclales bacterium]